MSLATAQDTQGHVTQMQFESVVHSILVKHFCGVRHAASALARAADASIRTAESWVSGRSIPRGHHLANLCIECDELTEALLFMIAAKKAARILAKGN
jgi:hypothetical protein